METIGDLCLFGGRGYLAELQYKQRVPVSGELQAKGLLSP
jgi:hypothetical protein